MIKRTILLACVNKETKDLAKDRGFRWDPVTHHGWVKSVAICDVMTEIKDYPFAVVDLSSGQVLSA